MENIVNSRKEIGDYIFVSKYARTVHGKKKRGIRVSIA